MRGHCLCGRIEFEVLGEVPRLYQCHCSLCRRQGGSSSNTATLVHAEDFRWLAGKEDIRSWVKDTGFRSDFCPTCGATVPNPLRDTPYVWVPAGLLDDGAEIEIAAHLYVGSRAPWDVIAAPGVQYKTAPALAEIIELLHRRTSA